MTRCTNCELPLSPTRTYTRCPRCGTALGKASESGPTIKVAPRQQEQDWGRGAQVMGAPAQNEPWRQAMQGATPPLAPAPPWQQGPATPAGLPQTPQPDQQWLPVQQSQQPTPNDWGQPAAMSPFAQPPQPPRRNLGFIISGFCIITGALILIFVYFMAVPLSNNTDTANTKTVNSTTFVSTPTANHSSPTAIPSPTATALPGQQFIDNAQMATAVDTTTASPTQPGTIFKPNQRIYITFSLHPGGKTGAACLTWYLNNRYVTHFSFPVGPNDRSGYSYAIYGQSGSGYVELSWASTITCSDKILAQHVDFTVRG